MTYTDTPKVYVRTSVGPATLFTQSEAILVQMLCTALDTKDTFIYAVRERSINVPWFKRHFNSVYVREMTHEHRFIVTRKVRAAGRQRQMYVNRQILNRRRLTP